MAHWTPRALDTAVTLPAWHPLSLPCWESLPACQGSISVHLNIV